MAGRFTFACAALLGVVAVCRAGPHDAQLGPLLGDDLAGAKVVAHRDGQCVVWTLATGEVRPVLRLWTAARPWAPSRPWWSPDGRQILIAQQGKAYVIPADGGPARPILTDVKRLQEPIWWREPASGELHVVYKDNDGKHVYRKGGRDGATWLARLSDGRTRKLADFPCDGGLSLDGTHLGEAYGGCLIVEVAAGRYHTLYGGGQACNASMSPDNSYRLMHLYLPHRWFGIRNKHDRELWKIEQPPGSGEWQTPRWSNHPDFCMAVAQFAKQYKPVLVRISDKKMVVFGDLPGDWKVPHLWLASAARGQIAASQPGEALTPRQKLARAEAEPDAARAAPLYRELADSADAALARQARERLASETFRRRLAAAAVLAELRKSADRLQPLAGSASVYTDAKFLARNRGTLATMARLAARMRSEFADTPEAALADAIAGRYRLPAEAIGDGNQRCQVIARVVAVSAIPDPKTVLYPELLTLLRYRVEKTLSGQPGGREIVVAHRAMKDHKLLPPASYKVGQRHKLTLDRFDAHPELAELNQAADAQSDLDAPVWWTLKVESP